MSDRPQLPRLLNHIGRERHEVAELALIAWKHFIAQVGVESALFEGLRFIPRSGAPSGYCRFKYGKKSTLLRTTILRVVRLSLLSQLARNMLAGLFQAWVETVPRLQAS